MDILYFVCLIIVIGIFFFLDKYSTSSNPMYVVVILSLIGFFMLMNTNIEIVNYSVVNATNPQLPQHPTIDITDSGFGPVNMQSFLVLVYWFTLIMGTVNLYYGKREAMKDD